MSISLNNHESRITALENRTLSGLSIISSSLTTNGFVEFSNTLIVNWGINRGTPNGTEYSLPKAFKKVGFIAVGSPHVPPSSVYWTQPATAYINGLTKIRVGGHSSTGNIAWIAIGILYTYRYIIKSAQKFTPLSYLFNKEV